MTDNKSSQTPHKPVLFQRIAAIGAIVGASSDEIDAAIIEIRKERRERQVSKRAKTRLAQRLKTGRMVQQ